MNSWFLSGAAACRATPRHCFARSRSAGRAVGCRSPRRACPGVDRRQQAERRRVERCSTCSSRAQLDGLASGPVLADARREHCSRAAGRCGAAEAEPPAVDRLGALRPGAPAPRAGDGLCRRLAPRRASKSPAQILPAAARARRWPDMSPKVSAVNPVYARLRDGGDCRDAADGGRADPRVLASLARLRHAAPQISATIIVDAASAQPVDGRGRPDRRRR